MSDWKGSSIVTCRNHPGSFFKNSSLGSSLDILIESGRDEMDMGILRLHASSSSPSP